MSCVGHRFGDFQDLLLGGGRAVTEFFRAVPEIRGTPPNAGGASLAHPIPALAALAFIAASSPSAGATSHSFFAFCLPRRGRSWALALTSVGLHFCLPSRLLPCGGWCQFVCWAGVLWWLRSPLLGGGRKSNPPFVHVLSALSSRKALKDLEQ